MSLHERKNEILWINTLKGFCILLVVLHHAVITTLIPSIDHLSAGQLPAKIWVLFNQVVSPLRMPAFFFVSGLLAANAISKKKWADIFTKKVSNLIYLYILWGVIQWFFIKLVISAISGIQLSDAENSAYSVTPSEFITLLLMAKTSLWYLYALAGYFVIAKLFQRVKYLLLILAVAFNYAAALGIIPGWGMVSLSQNMIFFLIGAFLSDLLTQASEVNKKNILLWIGLAVLGLINIKLGIGKNIFVCLLAIISAIIICRILNNHFNMAWLNWVGKNTLQIYVIHRIIIEGIGVTALGVGVESGMFKNNHLSLIWSITFPAFAVAFCTVSSLIIWTLCNRGVGKSLFAYPSIIKKDEVRSLEK
ncbi:acyltransferase [Serratia marcescens]|uniref:Acyltransferase n=1 Tax=Serratia marcescens TaxID=615 RepID=A0A1Q4NX91_SERMA|nr:acyltransferase family protein [Serratia marcescens]OKB65517.1 acyltransferase [Serratia marcescens]